jgi:tricarballylate dehydrogenase
VTNQNVVEEADVVVVGGGNAALCAALEARRFCSRVLVIESASPTNRGGNTRHTRNIRHVHRTGDGVVTGVYEADQMLEDLTKVSGPDIDVAMARMVIRESETCPAFMESHGVYWQPPLKGTLHLSRTNRFFLGGGKALVNAYYTAAARAGIQIRYDTEVQEVIFDRGLARGVLVRDPDETVRRVNAHAVVVASGGFEANLDWLERYWGPAAKQFVIRGTPHNTGVMLSSLLDQGAQSVGDPRGAHAICVDARAPKFDGGIVTRVDSVPLGIVVSSQGRRISDEGADIWPHRYASWGHIVAAQPDQKAFSIYDSKVAGTFIPPAFPPVVADSVEELGRSLDINSQELARTVDDYNAATPGLPADHSKLDAVSTHDLSPAKSNWAAPIDRPPYYAYPLRPGITFTFMGVQVTPDARVVFERTGAIPNLFAAGEVVSGNVLTQGYLAGFGLTIGTVFGRIAGGNAGAVASNSA